MTSPFDSKTTRNESPAKPSEFVIAGAVFVGFSNLVMFAALPAFNSAAGPFLVSAWLGAVVAQGALHAVWCVFAPVAGRVRVAVGAALALGWYGGALMGLALHVGDESEFWRFMLTGLLCLPLIALGIQVPLWVVRYWLRWRFVRADDDPADAGMTTLRIQHILWGTAWVALALGAARLANPEETDTEGAFLIGMLIAVAVLLLISAATVLPLLVATLYARSLRFSLSVVAFVCLAAAIAFGLVAAFMVPGPPPPPVGLFATGLSGACILGYAGGLTGVLLIVRKLGYRLQWGRPPSHTTTEPTGNEGTADTEA
jgi:hypothetical protein